MYYHQKYLKYKDKYLNLKNTINMVGGDKPQVNILKNINLFPSHSELEEYLSPTFGFILNETGFISNHYNFFNSNNKTNDIISTLVNKLFYKLPNSNEIKPTINLFNVKPKDIGLLLGYLYYHYLVIFLKFI